MLESKTNRVVLYVSAFLVVVLVLFALLRDNADPITLKEATKILVKPQRQKCCFNTRVCLSQNRKRALQNRNFSGFAKDVC